MVESSFRSAHDLHDEPIPLTKNLWDPPYNPAASDVARFVSFFFLLSVGGTIRGGKFGVGTGGAHVVHPNLLYSYLSRRHVVTGANPSSSLPAASLGVGGGVGRVGGSGGGGFIRYVEDDEDDLSSNDDNSDSDRGVGGVGGGGVGGAVVPGSGGGVARPGRVGAVMTSSAKSRGKIPPNARVRIDCQYLTRALVCECVCVCVPYRS